MANREQPVLRAKDAVTIRPWVRTDASGVMEAFEDSSIQQWHMRRLETKQEAIAWIKEWHRRWRAESDASWAVTGDDGVNLLGYVALRSVDLEYWVLPPFRGRRVATNACSVVAAWALADLGLHRLEVRHSVDNPASCRVASNAGFELEATLRSALLHADGWHDMHLHSRIGETS
jgi:RimJ/RimL family protein N-acetyltransferase